MKNFREMSDEELQHYIDTNSSANITTHGAYAEMQRRLAVRNTEQSGAAFKSIRDDLARLEKELVKAYWLNRLIFWMTALLVLAALLATADLLWHWTRVFRGAAP